MDASINVGDELDFDLLCHCSCGLLLLLLLLVVVVVVVVLWATSDAMGFHDPHQLPPRGFKGRWKAKVGKLGKEVKLLAEAYDANAETPTK